LSFMVTYRYAGPNEVSVSISTSESKKLCVPVMATRSRVRFSETPVLHNNPKQQQQQSSGWISWLSGGWRSKDSFEENSDNFSHAHTTVQPSAKIGECYATDSGTYVSYDPKVSLGVKPAAEKIEDESVDKEAEEFIERLKRKLETERLISMKRMESMRRQKG